VAVVCLVKLRTHALTRRKSCRRPCACPTTISAIVSVDFCRCGIVIREMLPTREVCRHARPQECRTPGYF